MDNEEEKGLSEEPKGKNFEPEFREYVLQILEPEMQSDIRKAESDEDQLSESERSTLN